MENQEYLILVKAKPEEGLLSVGSHSKGMFVGSISVVERRRHFEVHDHWYYAVHLLDDAGRYLSSDIRWYVGGKADSMALRTKCQTELNEFVRKLQGIRLRAIEIPPFYTKADGLVFGFIEDIDDEHGNPIFIYCPNRITFDSKHCG